MVRAFGAFVLLPTVMVNDSIDINLCILVSLSQNSPFALSHIGRSPRNIKMVESDKLVLNVHAKSKLESRAEQNYYFTTYNLGK